MQDRPPTQDRPAQLDAAPLPDELAELWRGYLRAWSSGLRREALALARDLVAGLDGLTDPARDEFAGWLCTRLFDEGEGWYGQFGGGLSYQLGGYERPIDYALSTHDLLTAVVVPHLVAHADDDGHRLLWLYQALIGFRWRLPPEPARQLEAALESVCGPEADPIDVLAVAAETDPAAARRLAGIVEE